MKTYHSIDYGYKWALIGLLAALFIPFFGPIWYGTRFTSKYYHRLILGGLVCLFTFILHTVLVGLLIENKL